MSIRRIGGSGGRLRWAMSATAVIVALLTAFTAPTFGTSVQDRQQPILDWLKSAPDLVIREAFRVVGMSQDEARLQSRWASIVLGLEQTPTFSRHPVYGKEPASRFLIDAFRAIGYDEATAAVLAGVAGARMNIRPDLDAQQIRKLEEQAAGLNVNQPELDGEHAASFLDVTRRAFTAVGYLDREADAFIDTLRDRWNLRGGEARRPNDPVLDWRRSNLHLVLTDAFVLAAGHTRADARQLAYNAMLQLNLGISAETFDRRGESVEAHPTTALFKHDPRGMTSRRVYTTHRNAPVPADLSFTLVVDDLAAEFTLDERAAQPVLKSVLDLPSRTVIRR